MTDPVMPIRSSPERTPGSDRTLIAYTIAALALAVFLRLFIAAPYVVQGASMDDTFHDWDYLIVDRVTYRFDDPQRGDVIVFDLPQDTTRALIKRVIGLPGDTVLIEGDAVTIIDTEHPKGFELSEPYVEPENRGGASNIRVTVPNDSYFVLGDNRRVSADSRIWGFLPRYDIVGRVLLRLYPLSDTGILPGQARYEGVASDN